MKDLFTKELKFIKIRNYHKIYIWLFLKLDKHYSPKYIFGYYNKNQANNIFKESILKFSQ